MTVRARHSRQGRSPVQRWMMESVWSRCPDQPEWKDRDGVERAGVCTRSTWHQRTMRRCWQSMPASERTSLHTGAGWQHQQSPWLSGSLQAHELSSSPWLCGRTCTGLLPLQVGQSWKNAILPQTWNVRHEGRFQSKVREKSSKILKILQLFQFMWRMEFKKILGLLVYERLF